VLKYPFLTSIEESGRFICGGSLIAERHVLTAAHCIKDSLAADKYAIVVFTQDANARVPTSCHERISVIRKMCRSDYDSDSSNNDVCLLALARPPACADKFPLPSLASRVPSGGIQATAAGWGTNQGAEEARPLLEVSLLLHSTRDCLSMLGAGFHSPQMICAGTTGRDTCQGDSGGPLVVRSISPSGEDAFEQVGVVSWGYGCGRQGRPGAYANVANYRGWIEQMLRQRLPAPDASSSSLSSSSTSSARPHCRNTCEYASDGACDDGGPGSEFAACGVGSDCSDCGSSSSSTTTSTSASSAASFATTASSSACSNSCEHASDGACDDGGPGSEFAACGIGDDCADCGRANRPSAPAITPPPTCKNDCESANDGDCDDGGPGFEYEV